MLSGAVYLDFAKPFDTIWIDGLLYKIKLLNFPFYSPYILIPPQGSDFRSSFPVATSSFRGIRPRVA